MDALRRLWIRHRTALVFSSFVLLAVILTLTPAGEVVRRVIISPELEGCEVRPECRKYVKRQIQRYIDRYVADAIGSTNVDRDGRPFEVDDMSDSSGGTAAPIAPQPDGSTSSPRAEDVGSGGSAPQTEPAEPGQPDVSQPDPPQQGGGSGGGGGGGGPPVEQDPVDQIVDGVQDIIRNPTAPVCDRLPPGVQPPPLC